MNPTMTTICLCMIVKDEAAVIRRCLDSVLPIISHWVIVDTGSTDGTQDIIREHLHNLPGKLHERPWRNFGHNRSEALVLARPYGKYSLVIDADDTLEIPDGYQMPALTADSYVLDIRGNSIRYRRIQIVRNRLPWRYSGVLHEFPTCKKARPSGSLPLIICRNHDGARRRDPQTYHRDAEILENALLTEADPFLISRYTFYLAQSYRDCGRKSKALNKYLARAQMGFWQEEVFQSLLQAARLKEELGYAEQEVLDAYAQAATAGPRRVEALHAGSRFCRLKKRFEEGYQLAKRGENVRQPDDALFVETWVYDYGLLDELAVNAYWSGHEKDSLEICERLLSSGKCPAGQLERIAANAAAARRKLSENAVSLVKSTGKEQTRWQPKIAIYTIALNEVHHVERWYKSAADADYFIVADTGSTDGTVERLKACGVEVHEIAVRPWRFDDARNASLALVPADADICISLDMDEFMFPGWRAQLATLWSPSTTRLTYNFASGLNANGSPTKTSRKSKIHSRWGYRWRRIIHEDLQRTESGEERANTDFLLIGQIQDLTKDRRQYLPLMERAHQEDPSDAQLCFWLAREMMYAGMIERSGEKYQAYLDSPNSNWRDERSEAMRFLARVRPDEALEWLHKALVEAGHRRELWLDLAEFYHSNADWLNLFWSCNSGIAKTRRTGSYLDDPNAWGYRIHDLAALGCLHLGLIDQAIKHGEAALELLPDDQRLKNNLAFYRSKALSGHHEEGR